MKFLPSVVFTLEVITFYTNAVDESIILPGDVYIGGLFSVQKNNKGRCDKMDLSSVIHVEAVKWFIENLNSGDYIPGIKIGIIAFKTCGLEELSAVYTNTLIQMSKGDYDCSVANQFKTNGTLKVIGIIGPENNEEAKVVSKILSMLPASQRLAQVGFSTTSMELSNRKEFPTFLRTIPSDEIQLKVFHELLQQLDWNYISIIHENDTYNTEYALRIKDLVRTSGVCVQALHPLHIENGGVNPDEIQKILQNITLREDPAVRGVIFIGSAEIAHALLFKTETLFVNNKPIYIFSNGLKLKESTFKDGSKVMDASSGSLLLSPQKIHVQSFTKYLNVVFQNESELLIESKVNSWLLDVYEEISGCRPTSTKHCPMLKEETIAQLFAQSVYLSYALRAAFAFSKTIKVLQSQSCNNGLGLCEDFKKQELGSYFTKLKTMCHNLATDIEKFDFQDLNFTYGLEIDLTNKMALDAVPLYEVYRYEKQSLDKGEFHQVGIYRNESLELDKNQLSNIPVSQCEPAKVCENCLKHDDGIFYVPGDYIIVVGISIRNKANSPLACSDIRASIGLELALGAIFIAKQFNEKKTIYSNTFPNKRIGVLVVDTCNEPLVIQKRILSLRETITKLGLPPDILDRILGYVGGIGSTATVGFADVTGGLRKPHIGFASTTPLLSDRTRFPYFARVSMSMDKQAEGMIKVAQAIGANYIQIVYSSGEYGEAGKRFIMQFAQTYNICIAQTPIEVPEGSVYYSILPTLRKKPHARVVMLILRSHVGPQVAKVLSEGMNIREFTFIGTESLGSRDEYLENNLKLQSTISFAQDLPQYPGFENYLNTQVPTPVDKDPWLTQFFQKRLNCYFPWSFDKTMQRQCNGSYKLPGRGRMDPWIPYVMRATESLLFGADEALKQLCGVSGGFCDNYVTKTDEVMNHIKNVRLNNQKVFDSNGNGNLGYTIYQIQTNPKDPLKLVYKMVGRWTADSKLELSKSSLHNTGDPSVCPNVQECCNYADNTTKTTEDKVGDNHVVPVFITVTVVLFLIIITLVVIMICCYRNSRFNGHNDPDYLTPADTGKHLDDHYHTTENTTRSYNAPQSAVSIHNRAFEDEDIQAENKPEFYFE